MFCEDQQENEDGVVANESLMKNAQDAQDAKTTQRMQSSSLKFMGRLPTVTKCNNINWIPQRDAAQRNTTP